MEAFTLVKDDELLGVNGGTGVLETLGILAGIYALVREMVRDAGIAAANKDLGI